MRISDRYERFNTDRVQTTKSNATKAADTSSTGTTAAATTTAGQSPVLSVSVSDQARGLAAAGSARIEQLRDQVRNGTFKIDAKDIASKLVGEDA